MKRIPPNKLPGYAIRKVWPIFFWVKCEKCEKEVRWEWVWKIFICTMRFGKDYPLPTSRYDYLCSVCCKSVADAEAYRKTIRDKINTPPCTPPSPTAKMLKAGDKEGAVQLIRATTGKMKDLKDRLG